MWHHFREKPRSDGTLLYLWKFYGLNIVSGDSQRGLTSFTGFPKCDIIPNGTSHVLGSLTWIPSIQNHTQITSSPPWQLPLFFLFGLLIDIFPLLCILSMDVQNKTKTHQYFSAPDTRELENYSISSFPGSKYQFGIWIQLLFQDSNIIWRYYSLWEIFLEGWRACFCLVFNKMLSKLQQSCWCLSFK